MKKLLLSITCLFPASLILAQEMTPTAPQRDADWVTLTDSAFTIQYPANWTVDKSGLMGAKFMLFAPLDDAGDNFKENINLQVTDLGAPDVVTLDVFADAATEQIKQFITEAKVVRAEKKGMGDAEYYEMEFTGTQGELLLHWEQHYRIRGQYAYILTFTASQESFDTYKVQAEKILGTFRIL